MVWWFTSTRHELAIGWARTWLGASFADRFFHTLFIGLPWWAFWGFVSLMSRSQDPLFLFGWVPWLFWIVDAIVERQHTNGDLNNLMSHDDVVLATRAEYVGGHPELPHGRFAYLTLEGDRENPTMTITFPGPNEEDDSFDIPLLDIEKTKPESDADQSLTSTLLATLTERPGRFLAGERVTLNVDYHGPGGRKHTVELTSFYHGNDEIRNWRNYLICAQAEADTGARPFGPWKSLKRAPAQEEVISDDGATGDGGKVQPARRAFERR